MIGSERNKIFMSHHLVQQPSHYLFEFIIILAFVMLGCSSEQREKGLSSVDYTALQRDDWQVSTPSEQDLEPKLVTEMYNNALELETIYSLLVVKNDYLVAEKYFHEGSLDQKARLQSVTKSFTSALVGIALNQGYITSVDQKMVDFFPEIEDQISDPRKRQITIRELLQMRAGYPWEETDADLWNGLLSGHYPELIEEFPLIDDPGTDFNYSNLSSNWLGIIVTRASGMSLKSFAEEHLFQKIDVEAGDWGQDADGHNNGCGDLHLSARDAAKFGLLYLNEGLYKGQRIIPSQWVYDSFQNYSDSINATGGFPANWGLKIRDIGYGYQWWSAKAGDHHFNFAWGHGGQFIAVADKLDMVIVITAYPYYLEHNDHSWKNEKANLNLIGTFIKTLPGNDRQAQSKAVTGSF